IWVRACHGRDRRRLVDVHGHGALGIEQLLGTGPETELDERSRIRNNLRLPAIGGLIAAEGFLGRGVPGTRGFAAEIMRLDQCLLDLLGTPAVDSLLAVALPAAAVAGARPRRLCVSWGCAVWCGAFV